MNFEFYSVTDATLTNSEYPWVQAILSGKTSDEECKVCGSIKTSMSEVVEVLCKPTQGKYWPDVLGCGAFPLLIVSNRVLQVWETNNVHVAHMHSIKVAEPWPQELRQNPPPYYWLDGHKMIGAKLDFEASGYVGVRVCDHCGTTRYDVGRTYDLQHSGTYGHVFVANTWNGAAIFTTDLSPYHFFCTGKIIELARRHKLTNFEFVPTDRSASSHEGIEYM